LHSASDAQDLQRPSIQRRKPHWRSHSHRCPCIPVEVQIAAQRPRSQNPSPHSSSLAQLRFGTFLDQGREGESFSMALSSGEGVNPEDCSPRSEGDVGDSEGSEDTGVGAGGGARFVGGGAFAPGSGCSTRPPAGASSVETQETKPARLVHTASPAEKILQRIRFIGILMATGTMS
jgi:hypothetical protein